MRTMRPIHDESCSVAACAGRRVRRNHRREMDRAPRPWPVRGATALLGARALLRRHQPADAVGTSARARGRENRRAPQLCGVPAAGRVRADREGRRAPADHRGDAPLRALLAGGRAGRSQL